MAVVEGDGGVEGDWVGIWSDSVFAGLKIFEELHDE
jgi:hypothetical protein